MVTGGSFVADLRVVMRGRDFRRLFATRLSSQACDGAFQVGLASVFFFSPERAATAVAAAGALTLAVLPYTLVGPFAGVVLDLWQRRQVLLVANAVRSVMVLGVAGLVLAGITGPPLYAAVLACMSVNRFFLAGLGAALPHVVPRHELVMANAVSPTSGTVAALAGAASGYALRGLLGAGDRTDALVVALSAVGYAGSALLAARIPRDGLGPDEPPPPHLSSVRTAVAGVVADVAAGARHVRERRPAAAALGAIGCHRLAYGISTIATLLLCRNRLNDPADVDAGLALLAEVVAATGLGFAMSALVTPPAARRLTPSGWIVACFGGAAASQAVFLVTLDRVVLVVGAFVLGIAAQGSKICVDAIVQDAVDDAFRGRVFSFYDVVFNAAFVAAAALGALVLPFEGYSPVVYTAIALWYLATAVGYRRVSRTAGSALPTAPLDPTSPQAG